jgi:triosephosphate isomerase
MLETHLTPIICIGEQRSEYEHGKAPEVLQKQLRGALQDVSKSRVSNCIIAYEPLWSISTMTEHPKTPQENEIMSVQLLLRKELSLMYSRKIAETIPILYGGSVRSKNCEMFVGPAKMDGMLIGGASLQASEFLSILKKTDTLFQT